MQFPSDVQDPRYAGLYDPAEPLPPEQLNINSGPGPKPDFLVGWLARCEKLIDKYHFEPVKFRATRLSNQKCFKRKF